MSDKDELRRVVHAQDWIVLAVLVAFTLLVLWAVTR